MARQLRDAQCHTIWEGTENILCIDVRRAMRGEQAHLALFARMEQALDTRHGPQGPRPARSTPWPLLCPTPRTRPPTSRAPPTTWPCSRAGGSPSCWPTPSEGGAPGRTGGVGARSRRRRPQSGRRPTLRFAGGWRPHRCAASPIPTAWSSTCSNRSFATVRSRTPTSPRDQAGACPVRPLLVTGPSPLGDVAALTQGRALEGVGRLVDAALDLGHPVQAALAGSARPRLGAWPTRWRTSCRPPGAGPRRCRPRRRTTPARGRPRQLWTAGRMSSINSFRSSDRRRRSSSVSSGMPPLCRGQTSHRAAALRPGPSRASGYHAGVPFEPPATHVPGVHGARPVATRDRLPARFEDGADPDACPGASR